MSTALSRQIIKNKIRDTILKTIIKGKPMAKDMKDNSTIDMFEQKYPKQNRGRKPIYERAMTAAERSRKYRADNKRRAIDLA
jgi:hypothetical protein